jgi:hypothetical protein
MFITRLCILTQEIIRKQGEGEGSTHPAGGLKSVVLNTLLINHSDNHHVPWQREADATIKIGQWLVALLNW